MGYIQDFETRMRVILEGYVPEEVLKQALAAAKAAVLESYQNGIQHGRREPDGKRRPQRDNRRTYRRR